MIVDHPRLDQEVDMLDVSGGELGGVEGRRRRKDASSSEATVLLVAAVLLLALVL